MCTLYQSPTRDVYRLVFFISLFRNDQHGSVEGQLLLTFTTMLWMMMMMMAKAMRMMITDIDDTCSGCRHSVQQKHLSTANPWRIKKPVTATAGMARLLFPVSACLFCSSRWAINSSDPVDGQPTGRIIKSTKERAVRSGQGQLGAARRSNKRRPSRWDGAVSTEPRTERAKG